MDLLQCSIAELERQPRLTADTVIMNPPFGTRRKGADLDFLRAAFRVRTHMRGPASSCAKPVHYLRCYSHLSVLLVWVGTLVGPFSWPAAMICRQWQHFCRMTYACHSRGMILWCLLGLPSAEVRLLCTAQPLCAMAKQQHKTCSRQIISSMPDTDHLSEARQKLQLQAA